jgi:hypothetical protein
VTPDTLTGDSSLAGCARGQAAPACNNAYKCADRLLETYGGNADHFTDVAEHIFQSAAEAAGLLGLELHKPNEDRGTVDTGFERLFVRSRGRPAGLAAPPGHGRQAGRLHPELARAVRFAKRVSEIRVSISSSVGRRDVRRGPAAGVIHPTRGSSPAQVGVAG